MRKFKPGDKVKINFDNYEGSRQVRENFGDFGVVLGYTAESDIWPVVVQNDKCGDHVEYDGESYNGYVFREDELDLFYAPNTKELI